MNGTSLKSDFKHWLKQGNAVTILIIINVAVFLMFALLELTNFFSKNALGNVYDFMYDNLVVHTQFSILLQKPWGLLTSTITHVDTWHLLGNMLIFFFFGNMFRSELGNRRVVPLYIISGILCSIVMVLAENILPYNNGADIRGLGASGAVMCFLVAAATLMPNLEIAIFFVINVRIKWVAAAIIVIDLVSLSRGNFGGHIAHLTGALFGYIFIHTLRNGTDLTLPLANFFSWVGSKFERNPAPQKFKPKKSPLRVVKRDVPSRATRLDQLLDKINEKGYDSLSADEKQWLRKYSDEK